MLLIVALAGLAGSVVFCALFIIMGLKGNSVKLPAIGLGACGLVVGVVAVLAVLGIGVPDGETAGGDGHTVSGNANDAGSFDETDHERISHTEYIGKNGKMIIVFRNNDSSKIPYFDAEITFFDANKNMVSVETDGHDAVLPGTEVVSIRETPENYESYEIAFKYGDYGSGYENLSKDVEVQDNVGENGVVARFTNNSDKEIEELEVVAVYYKNGEVIGADEEETYHIASGEYTTLQFYPPYDSEYKTIEFDSYKLYINQAHNFNIG